MAGAGCATDARRRWARRVRRAASAPRTAALICLMCSGVVPQQPPTTRTLCRMKRRAYDAMYSGEQR